MDQFKTLNSLCDFRETNVWRRFNPTGINSVQLLYFRCVIKHWTSEFGIKLVCFHVQKRVGVQDVSQETGNDQIRFDVSQLISSK